ncbi:MAG: hypothetical protein PHV85_02455 [Desulfovibrionaceae bacterium]|nr:hypothetical protein [Desulfovibrionaceae bacterium]
MLDTIAYRQFETLAKAALPNWQIAQRHNLDHFEKTGFPVRISSLGETRQLIDTMQEDGFEKYRDDLGGLGPKDLELLVGACADLVGFQLIHYPDQTPIVPLDTAMAMLCAWKRIRALKPSFRTLLEVGPGCGYLGLFAAGHGPLTNYSSVESCESFYLLQHYINIFAFGPGFRQMIYPQFRSSHFTAQERGASKIAAPAAAGRRAFHYPWWRLRALYEAEVEFDLVVCNANLLEFNPEALRDYLELFKAKLSPEGMIFVQSFGYESEEKNKAYLFDLLHEHGLAPLFITLGSLPKDREYWADKTRGECAFIRSKDPRLFASDYAVLVTESHPRFSDCHDPGNYKNAFALDTPELAGFFEPPEQGARDYSRAELAEAVARRLEQGGA